MTPATIAATLAATVHATDAAETRNAARRPSRERTGGGVLIVLLGVDDTVADQTSRHSVGKSTDQRIPRQTKICYEARSCTLRARSRRFASRIPVENAPSAYPKRAALDASPAKSSRPATGAASAS